MTPSDVTAFCRRWHDAIREWGKATNGLPCTLSELDEYESALARQLEGRRHLRTLASSPLLCAMLCALNLDRRKQLPLDRMKLYEASLDMLLERRDIERELPVTQDIRLDARAKITILQHLAWWLTLNGNAETSLPEARRQVELAISRMPDVDTNASTALTYLLNRSGVIREPIKGRVDFIHKTFQEYLAAKQAAEEHFIDFLVQHAHEEQWRETVVMGAGHATVPLRNRMMSTLLELANERTAYTRQLKIVAASCLDTAYTLAPSLTKQVEDVLEELIPPQDALEASSLAVAGERVLRHLPNTLNRLTGEQAAACVRTAALIGGSEALQLLGHYSAHQNQAVQTGLENSWSYFPAEQYAATVLANAPLHSGQIIVRRVEHVRHLKYLKNLRRTAIDLDADHNLDSLDFLDDARHLSILDAKIQDGASVSLEPIAQHSQVHMVRLKSDKGYVEDIESLREARALRWLTIPLSEDTTDLNCASELQSLDVLHLDNCSNLREISALSNLSRLHKLRVSRCADLVSNQPLSVSDLVLHMVHFDNIATSIQASFPNLQSLSLQNCSGVNTFDAIRNTALTSLIIEHCDVSDLTTLAGMKNLERLVIFNSVSTDLSPLVELPMLRNLAIYGPDTIDLTPFAHRTTPLTIEISERRSRDAVGVSRLGPNVTLARHH